MRDGRDHFWERSDGQQQALFVPNGYKVVFQLQTGSLNAAMRSSRLRSLE